MPVVVVLFVRLLVEIGRAPFNSVEGERELVSGFNIELGEVGFALLFIGEYGLLIFFRLLMSLISGVYFMAIVVMTFRLLATCPRVRYD